MVRLCIESEAHAQPEFGVVLEERVVPGRPATLGVHRPRGGGQVGAVDGRAASRVGHDHAVAEELADELEVRRLAASGAGAGELEEGFEHLGTLDRVVRQQTAIELRDGLEEVPVRPLDVAVELHGLHVDGLVADLRLALGGADIDAHAAAGAVVRRDLDGQAVVRQVVRAELLALEAIGRGGHGGSREDLHANSPVGADDGALSAVDADAGVPHRDVLGDGAFLVLGRAGREGAVDGHRAHRQLVALAGDEGRGDAADELPGVVSGGPGHHHPGSGGAQRDVGEPFEGAVDGREVAGDDRLAALGVGLDHRVLDARRGFVGGQHARQAEEAGLHDRVDAITHAHLVGHGEGIDDPEIDPLLHQRAAHVAGQAVPDLVGAVRRVEQKGRPVPGMLQDIDLGEQAELVAGHEIRPIDEVGGTDGLWPEA